MESCEFLCECPLLDIEEIAESIEEVRGGCRPISIRCAGVVDVIAGGLSVGEVEPTFARIGVETLRIGAFEVVSCNGRPYLLGVSGLIIQVKLSSTSNCLVFGVVWQCGQKYRSSSPSPINHQGALLAIEAPAEDSDLLSYL